MYCGKCGNQTGDDAVFCNQCGAPMAAGQGPAPASGEQEPADVTAVLEPVATATAMPSADTTVPAEAWPAASASQPYPEAYAQPAGAQPDWVSAQAAYQPQPQYAAPPKSGNGMMITAIVIAAVLVLGAGGFALWKTGVIGGEKSETTSSADRESKDDQDEATGGAADSDEGDDSVSTEDGGDMAQDEATADDAGVVTDDGGITQPESYDISYSAGLSVSSQLPASQGVSYGPENLLDDRGDTCWAENASGYGRGEWVEFTYTSPVTVTGIEVLPGYDKFKDVDRWYSNGRVKKARVEFSDGTSEEVRFADEKTVQMRTFAQPHETTYVRFVISTAYEATGDRAAADTSIGHMRIYGY